MNVTQFDSLFASGARPFSIYLLAVGVFLAIFSPVHGIAEEALGIAAGVLVGYGAARTYERTTATKVGAPDPTKTEKANG